MRNDLHRREEIRAALFTEAHNDSVSKYLSPHPSSPTPPLCLCAFSFSLCRWTLATNHHHMHWLVIDNQFSKKWKICHNGNGLPYHSFSILGYISPLISRWTCLSYFLCFRKKVFPVHKDLKMDLLTTKIVTMSILGSVSLLIGFIPMLVAKKFSFD